MSSTMKSPLMDNTDEQIANECCKHSKSKSNSSKKEKLARNPKNQSTSTQTSVNYNPLSPLSVQNSLSVLNSTHIQSAILCRICYNSDMKESLLQPCDCSGTMGLIHRTCLEKWLSQCNKNNCEICGFNYNVQRRKRPFSAWLCRPITNKDSKNLLNDLLCFLILTPLAFISTWYCLGFAFKFTNTANNWESSGLVILTSFLEIIYTLWLSFSIRYQYKVFHDWQEKNQIVTLQIEKSKILLSSNLIKMKRDLSVTQTTIDQNASVQTVQSIENNQTSPESRIDLMEGDSKDEQQAMTTIRKPIYRKESDVEFKIESCVIEV